MVLVPRFLCLILPLLIVLPLCAKTTPKFASVTISPCTAYQSPPPQIPGHLQTACLTLARLIEQAYGLYADGIRTDLSPTTVEDGPSWLRTDFYKIDAQAPGQTHAMMNGPMLQALLEDRFRLRVHHDSAQVPVYALTAVKNAVKLLPVFQGTCPSEETCAQPDHFTADSFDLDGATMLDLCRFLGPLLDRPVLDQTGINGRFVLHLDVPTAVLRSHASPALTTALQSALHKLGLSLQPTDGPRPFIAVDSVARP